MHSDFAMLAYMAMNIAMASGVVHNCFRHLFDYHPMGLSRHTISDQNLAGEGTCMCARRMESGLRNGLPKAFNLSAPRT